MCRFMPAKNSAAVESVISALRNHVVLLCAAADTPQQSARITVAPDQLLGNTRYRLSVEARTPGSDVGSSNFDFWVAQQPFGGSCIVTSPDGECHATCIEPLQLLAGMPQQATYCHQHH